MPPLKRNVDSAFHLGVNSGIHDSPSFFHLKITTCEGQEEVKEGPVVLQEDGLLNRLRAQGCSAEEYGNLYFDVLPNDNPFNKMKNPRSLGKANKILAGVVEDVKRNGKISLVLGEDHSLAIGTIFGHAGVHPDLCLIWLDGPTDINTPLTSLSGNLHGQHLAFLIKELKAHPSLSTYEIIELLFALSNSQCCLALRFSPVFLSIFSVQFEVQVKKSHSCILYSTFLSNLVNSLGIKCFSMSEVDKLGIGKMMEETLAYLWAKKKGPIHFSFDIGGLDPSLAPAIGTPVPGGMRKSSECCLISTVRMKLAFIFTGLLSAVDIMELNLACGKALEEVNTTTSSAVAMLLSCFGASRGGISYCCVP
ncbi:arginase-1 [Liasis olivaceus]